MHEHTTPVPAPFDYALLEEETRQFIQHKTDETQMLLKRTTEHILQIGFNLKAVKERLPHGQFLPWLQAEFGMSRWTAQNFMRVAERLGDQWGNFHHFPLSVLYELSAPSTSDALLEQVKQGQVPATQEAIRAAKEAERRAQETLAAARIEVEASHHALQQMQEQAQAERQRLHMQIEQLQEERTRLLAREPQIREIEVEKSVVPPEMQQRMHTLEAQIAQLTNQRDTLSRQLTSMGEQAREAVLQRNAQTYERQFCQRWRKVAGEFEQSGNQFLAHLPSSLELEGFEMQDWATLERIEALLPRLTEAVHHFHVMSSQVIDAR